MEIVAELADVKVVQELPVPGETVVANDTPPKITTGKAFMDGSNSPLGVRDPTPTPLGDTGVATTPESGHQSEPKKTSPSARLRQFLLNKKAEALAKQSHSPETVEPKLQEQPVETLDEHEEKDGKSQDKVESKLPEQPVETLDEHEEKDSKSQDKVEPKLPEQPVEPLDEHEEKDSKSQDKVEPKLPEQPVETLDEHEEKDRKSQDKTNEALQQHAKARLPERPKCLEQIEYVTAEQQQPSKPRGRKPRTTKDGEPTTAVASKSNSRKRSNTAKPEEPEKKPRRTSKKQAPTEPATAPKASAKSKAKAKASKSTGAYEAMQVDGDVGRDRGATFDAYAAASAAADVHRLSQPSPAPIEHDKAEPPKKRSRKETKSSDQKGKDGGDAGGNDVVVEGGEAAGSKPSGRSAESKALLSRKSCAYKRVLNIKLKEGATRDDAKIAARAVSYFECDEVV